MYIMVLKQKDIGVVNAIVRKENLEKKRHFEKKNDLENLRMTTEFRKKRF